METSLTNDILTPSEAARALGINVRTLQRYHAQRIGPPRIKFGRQVRYRAAAVREWLLSREQTEVRAGGDH